MTPFLHEGYKNNSVIQNRKPKRKAVASSFIYKSKVMGDVMRFANKVAPLKTPLFIFGSKGTGKKSLAYEIHKKSKVHFGPLNTINCNSFSEKVFTTELFGFKGSETTASSEGALRKSDGGTLVLENAHSLSTEIQERLYRYMQTGEIVPVGASIPVVVQVRLVFTINSTETAFQNSSVYNLYNQINPLRISLPDLKDRKEDISDLVHYFLSLNSSVKARISKPAVDALKCYKWPGNLTELKNICERTQIFSKDNEITVNDLPRYFFDTDKCSIEIKYDPSLKLSDISRLYILNALKHFPSKKQAAKALGITVKTLYNRIHEYGIFEQYSVHED